MSRIRFDAPPRLQDQLTYQYLFRVAQDLNLALQSIDEGNMTPEAAAQLKTGGTAGAQAQKEIAEQASTLRSMIVKNAETVQQEMDRLQVELSGTYLAKSEFGTYKNDIRTEIDALPASITQTVLMTETFTDMAGAIDALEAYTVQTEGFIKQGFIGYDENGDPVIGIAIGQGIETTGSTVTVDGVTYDVINTARTLGVYTSKGLSFYQNGTEVAYLKNSRLYITDAAVTGTQTIGSWKWEQDSVRGLTLRYIG